MQFSFDGILQRLKGFVSSIYYPEGIGIGILCFLAVLMIIFSKRHKDFQWILILMIVGHFVLGFHVLMNCFLYAPYAVGRWHYILYFCISMALAIGGEEWIKKGSEKKQLRLWAGTICFFTYCLCILLPALKKGFYSNEKLWRFIAVSIAGVIILFVLLRRPKRSAMLLMTACFISVGASAYPTFYQKDDFVDADIYRRITRGELAKAARIDQEKGGWRTDLNDSVRMASLVIGFPGTKSYFSVQNEGYYDFLRDMACSASLFGGNVNMGSLDGRKSLEIITSVGTYSDDLNNTTIHGNDESLLPIGFAYDSYMLNDEALELDPLDRSNGVMKTVYLEETPSLEIRHIEKEKLDNHLWETIMIREADSQTHPDGLNISIFCPKGSIIMDEKSEYYLYIRSITSSEWLSMIWINGNKKLLRFTPAGEAANKRGEYLAKLAIDESIIENETIDLYSESGPYQLGSIEIRKLDISGYQEDYQKLAAHVLRDISMTPDRITGSISCKDDSILFTSILYDPRWTCLVDGIPARIHKADSGFLAAEIIKGEHEIVLEYRSKLQWISWLIFIGTIGLIMIYKYVTDKNKIKVG